MKEENGVVRSFDSAELACGACGGARVTTRYEHETIRYGDSDDAVEIKVRVPVRTCEDCGFEFTDNVAAERRHEAVCAFRGVMPPRLIIALRERSGLSRAEFARLSRIGEASLARWETGALIQNPANDQYLYLLGFEDNHARLRRRAASSEKESLANDQPTGAADMPRFRVLRPSTNLVAAAERFQLRVA